MRIFTIYDSKAEAYHQPFYSRTEGEAVRSCEQAANTEGQFSTYAEDFILFEIGNFDEMTGELTATAGRSIIKFNELKKTAPLPTVGQLAGGME